MVHVSMYLHEDVKFNVNRQYKKNYIVYAHKVSTIDIVSEFKANQISQIDVYICRISCVNRLPDFFKNLFLNIDCSENWVPCPKLILEIKKKNP